MKEELSVLHVVLDNPCEKCGEQVVLLRFSEGGFVKGFCGCGHRIVAWSSVEMALEKHSVRCKSCTSLMRAVENVGYRNWGFECRKCGAKRQLADLLPRCER